MLKVGVGSQGQQPQTCLKIVCPYTGMELLEGEGREGGGEEGEGGGGEEEGGRGRERGERKM